MENSDGRETNNTEHRFEYKQLAEDDQATTSKGAALKDDHTFDNMNDLQPMEFNSADAVRQTMKAIIAGKVPPLAEESSHPHSHRKTEPRKAQPLKINELSNKQFCPMGQYVRSLYSSKTQIQNLSQSGSKLKKGICKRYVLRSSTSRSRAEAGPSRKIKRPEIVSMYVGKLSNVMSIKEQSESESDSDVESVVMYY
ncbi:uncharacterized protein LOC142976864 [Anticarsia gemmatalis]|uniref:uncharacterized protein LOC142976864 n=1 Tax=Anticarsia gemmatalis TaxID=129554 RepID=UPI003F7718E1